MNNMDKEMDFNEVVPDKKSSDAASIQAPAEDGFTPGEPDDNDHDIQMAVPNAQIVGDALEPNPLIARENAGAATGEILEQTVPTEDASRQINSKSIPVIHKEDETSQGIANIN